MKTIAVYNLKGGVGKTATAVNLAYLSAFTGARTCLWDLDPQAAASWYLNCKTKSGFKFSKLAKEKLSLGEQIQATEFEHLDMIPADLTHRNVDHQMAHAGPERLKDWLDSLSEIYQTAILGLPSVTVFFGRIGLEASRFSIGTSTPNLSFISNLSPTDKLNERKKKYLLRSYTRSSL